VKRGRRRAVLALTAAGLLAPLIAAGQGYPSKPIRFLVPYPPGGGTDLVARAVAQKLQDSMGQPVVVENKPGGSEIISTEAAARSAPDGYTIALVTNAFAINAGAGRKLPFDPVADFVPVAYLVSVPFLLVVHPSVPASSVQELVALAKAQPGKLNYASLGSGSPHGLAIEWFKKLAGIDLTEVPYKGVAQAMAAGAAGEVQVLFTGLTAGLAQVKSGRLKAIAVSPAKRVAAVPELPSIAEAGYPDFDVTTWYGVVAPAGTPGSIVSKLNAEIDKTLGLPDLKERLAGIGVDPLPMSAAEFGQAMQKDLRLWSRVIKATGAKVE